MTTTTSTSRRSSSSSHGDLQIRWSARSDGDFHRTNVPFGELEHRRRSFVDLPWTMLDQQHSDEVVRISEPGGGDGESGDAAITQLSGAVLACWVADCAPVVLVGAEREFAVIHAGWVGLSRGVIDAAVDAFTEPIVDAVVGPTIHPCCYEFGESELVAVAAGVHAEPGGVLGTTRLGLPALDMPAAVTAALTHRGIEPSEVAACTGCAYDGFSHRVHNDPERHVVAAWRREGAA